MSKKKKEKLRYVEHVSREQAIAYFEDILTGLKQGHLEFHGGDRSLAFELPEHVRLKVKAAKKPSKDAHKISFSLSWRDAGSDDEAVSKLDVSSD